jgi:hypothetical protein
MLRVKTFMMTAVFAALLAAAGASVAFAGEITGNGKPTQGPAHASSICVFSGQNDDPTAPIISAEPIPGIAPNGPGGRTQNYGQDVRHGLINPTDGFTPGDACGHGTNPDSGK